MPTLIDKEIYELTAQHEWQSYNFLELLDVSCEYWRAFRYCEELKEMIGLSDSPTVLDVGCGVVSVLNVMRREFAHLQLVGVDPLVEEYERLYSLDRSISTTALARV